ncbi:MAG: tetratricopeptide repeat protein [Bryobacteraceae bacterium]
MLLLFRCATLHAQQPQNLTARIRAAHLPAEVREQLESAYGAKDYARMRVTLDRQLAAGTDNAARAEIYALAGAADFLGGRMATAADAFQRSNGLAPLDESDRFTWAMALVHLGQADAAREQLTLLNVSRPDRPLYLYWLGRIDYDQRRYVEAVEKLKRVIQRDPASARAYDALGLAFDMMGQPEDAREAFVKAVDLNRKLSQPSAWPPHNLGNLLLRVQQPRDAEVLLREALEYDPGFAMAHYHLGRALEAEGRDNEAIGEYRVAVSLDKELIEPLYSLGLLYRRHGRKVEAEAAFAEYKIRKSKTPVP